MESSEQPAESYQARPAPTYVGNSNDLTAVVAATVSGIGLLCCVTGGSAVYCLPLIGLALGIVGWIQASQSADPERTKKLAMFSTISMAAVFAVMILALIAYFAYIVIMIVVVAAAGSQ